MLLFSCTDRAYTGTVDEELVGTASYPVIISVGTPEDVISKGSGAADFDDGWMWDDACVYIYAFSRNEGTSFAVRSENDRMSCLVDASSDIPGARAGRRAGVNSLDSYIMWAEGADEIFYPEGTAPYDFYAYYLDDFEPSDDDILRTDDLVSIPVVIDGSRDLMSARGRLSESQLAGGNFSESDRLNIANYAFSAFTANRNIHPVLNFRHHLARLRFEIYPGQQEAERIYIEKISISSRTDAVFTVVHKDEERIGLDFSGGNSYSELFLMEEDGRTPLRQDYYTTEWDADFSGDVYDRPKVVVGGSLLVAPDTEYECTVYMKEILSDSNVRHSANTVVLNSSEGEFSGGKQYVVRIALYGLSDVECSVSLVPWGNGGGLVVDGEENGQ